MPLYLVVAKQGEAQQPPAAVIHHGGRSLENHRCAQQAVSLLRRLHLGGAELGMIGLSISLVWQVLAGQSFITQ